MPSNRAFLGTGLSATALASAPVLICKLLVSSDLAPSVSRLHRVSIVGAFLADNRHSLTIHGPAGLPLVACTLVRSIQIVNEIALVSLTTDDALLCAGHPGAQNSGTGTHLLW